MTAAGHAPVAAIRNMTSRLESERLLATASHDLREPLQTLVLDSSL